MTEKERSEFAAEKNLAAFKKMQQNVRVIREFLDDLEKVIDELNRSGVNTDKLGHFVTRVRRRVVIVGVAVDATGDAVQAAVDTQNDLSAWYRQAYAACRNGRDSDEEFICMAAIDRQYQARNVKFVLGSQDGSFVRRVLDRWRTRLLDLVTPI